MHGLLHSRRNIEAYVVLNCLWPGKSIICCPGVRRLRATRFINVCANQCNRHIITGAAVLEVYFWGRGRGAGWEEVGIGRWKGVT